MQLPKQNNCYWYNIKYCERIQKLRENIIIYLITEIVETFLKWILCEILEFKQAFYWVLCDFATNMMDTLQSSYQRSLGMTHAYDRPISEFDPHSRFGFYGDRMAQSYQNQLPVNLNRQGYHSYQDSKFFFIFILKLSICAFET